MTHGGRWVQHKAAWRVARVAGIVCLTGLSSCGSTREQADSAHAAGNDGVAESREARLLIGSVRSRFTVPSSDPASESGTRVPVLARSDATRFVLKDSRIVPQLDDGSTRGVLHLASVTLPARSSGATQVVDQTSKMAIEVSFEDAGDVAAEAFDGYLVYRNALQSVGGSSVVLRVKAEGIEDYVLLDAPPADPRVDYRVVLAQDIAGLRLVANVLEFLDAQGVPRLRVPPPYLVDASGQHHRARIEVLGCAVDSDPSPPMNRPTTNPGSGACGVRIAWAAEDSIAFPALLDPGWTSTGSTILPRTYAGAARLANGKVLAAGGSSPPEAWDSSELFDPLTQTWSSSGTLVAGRGGGSLMAALGPGAIIYGGDSIITNAAHTSEEWNNGVWAFKAPTEFVNGSGRTMTTYGTSVMLVGGYGGPVPGVQTDQKSTARYNVATHTWIPVAWMQTGRTAPRATQLQDGRVLVTGGTFEGALLDTAEVLNGSTWTLLTSKMSAKRTDHVSELLPDGRVLVALGAALSVKVDIFDPAANSFSPSVDFPLSTLSTPRGFLLPNRRVAIVGAAPNAATYAFLPGEDAGWVNVANLITPRSSPIALALSVGGHALYAGGSSPTEVLTLWPNGAAKSTGQPCASGYSVDSVCCDTACAGQCDSCSTGTCTRITGAGSPSCAPYLCTGSTSGCPTTCASDAACVSTHYCAAGTCQPKKSNGQACTADNQCTLAHCVDSVCCNTACAGACDVCNATPGTCSLLADGTPVTACSPYLCNGSGATCPTSCVTTADCSAGSACVAGKCQMQGQGTPCSGAGDCGGSFPYCVDSVCCDTACSGGCDRCNVAGLQGLCTLQPAGTPPTGCSANSQPYSCPGNSGACPTSCASDANCITGYYCSGSSCLPRKNLGTTCAAGSECLSSSCVDNVCCNTACDGPCDVCNKSGSGGTCSPAGVGTPGSPSCAPFKCAAGASCATTCVNDTGCTAGFYCGPGNTCQPQLGLGAPCTVTTECTGALVCVDQVCCDNDCTGACRSCLASKKGEGVDGMCGFILTATDPDNECAATDPLTCGMTGQCDGAGKCGQHPLGTPCGSVTTCTQGFETRFECNGIGSCDPKETATCAPYACLGSTCAASCTDDSACADSTYCVTSTHTCVPKLGIGAACAANSQCGSDVCADGVCCDKACTGQCYACSQAAKGHGDDGVCEPITAGSPDSDQPCPQDAVSTCGRSGTCSGTGACSYYAAGTACKGTASCVGASSVGWVCNSFNECVQDTSGIDCSPYLCNDGPGCASSCTLDADCIAEHFCDAGQCQPQRTPGEPCAKDGACKSGTCVDGVCCTSECDGSCERCDLPNAQSAVDGVCRVVPADTVPEGGHVPCAGQPTDLCAGRCDGTSPSCVYPNASTPCPGSSCIGNVAMPKACDGLGACAGMDSVDCAAYACDSAAGQCKNTCLTGTDCAPGASCNQATGVCAINTNTCVDEFTSQSTDGKKTSCTPYKCSGGVCAQACTTSADCASAFECQGTKCIEAPAGQSDAGAGGNAGGSGAPAAEASGDSGGCSIAAASSPRPWFASLVGIVALLELVRRRRRSRLPV